MELAEISEKAAMEREAELERALLLKNRILQDYSQWRGFLLSNGIKEKLEERPGKCSGLELGSGDSIVRLGVLIALKDPIGGALAIAMGGPKSVFEISDPACILSGVIERFSLLEGDIRKIRRINRRLGNEERLRLDIISKSLSLSKTKVAALRKNLGCCKEAGKCKGNCRVRNAGPALGNRAAGSARQARP